MKLLWIGLLFTLVSFNKGSVNGISGIQAQLFLGRHSTTSFYPNNFQLRIGPNPALYNVTLFYTISTDEVITINLMNHEGIVVKNSLTNVAQTPDTYEQVLDVSDLKPGMYFVSIMSASGGLSLEKIIINRWN